VPISDWWGGSHKIHQHQAKVNEAQFRLEQTADLLKLQIQKAFNELTENYFQVQTARQSVDMATENLRITTDNYKAGVMSVADLLEAQAEYQKALDSLTEAQCNFQVAKARYLQVVNRYQ
jgi:outer membrane protein TolC